MVLVYWGLVLIAWDNVGGKSLGFQLVEIVTCNWSIWKWSRGIRNLSGIGGFFFVKGVRDRVGVKDEVGVLKEVNLVLPRPSLVGDEVFISTSRIETSLPSAVDPILEHYNITLLLLCITL